MTGTPINPTEVSYAQAYLADPTKRLLFISGQVPEQADGYVPSSFDDQCRLAWSNVEQQLRLVDMSFNNLVKVTIYLSDRQYRQANARIRHDMLQGHAPALTIIIADIYEEHWLLEIEGVAMG
jgi:2-iminobutanoate/2-iminopropanoate deaminase